MPWWNPKTWDAGDLDPRNWDEGDAYDVLGGPLGSGLIRDATGNAQDIPGMPDYRNVNFDFGVKPAYDVPTQTINKNLSDLRSDRARIEGWHGTSPIRDVKDVRPMDIPYEDVGYVAPGTAYTSGPVERYSASKISAARDVNAPGIQAIRQARAEGYDAATIGDAERAGGVQVGRAVVDTGAANRLTGAETGNLAELSKAAEGRGPSAAGATLKQGLAESAQQALGAAAAARGSERAGARREALQAIGEGGFKEAQAAAALKAGEQQAARQQLTSAISQGRSQDIALSTKIAEITQQADNLQAEIDKQISLGNASQANALKARQAELRQQASEFGASAKNRAEEVNAGATNLRDIELARQKLNADTTNASLENVRNIRQGELDTGATAAGVTEANKRADTEAQRKTDVEQQNLERQTGVRVTDANRRGTVDINSANQNLQAQTTNNELGIRRDTLESDRARGDFATQEGLLGGVRASSGTAAGQQIQVAGGTVQGLASQTDAQLAAYAAQGNQAAARELNRRRAQQAAWNLAFKVGSAIGTGGASAGIPGVPGVPIGGGATPYNLPVGMGGEDEG